MRVNWDKPRNLETYPRASMVTYRFAARDKFLALKLTWYDGGLIPPRPEELEPGRSMGDKYGGILFIGTKGKILSGSHGANEVRIIPEEKMRAYRQPPKTIQRSIGHRKEWIEACKGGPIPGANFDYAGPLTETVLLGNLAIRMGEKLEWDAENFKITNLSDANKYLHRDYRKGWSL